MKIANIDFENTCDKYDVIDSNILETELSWKDFINKVLTDYNSPLNYDDLNHYNEPIEFEINEIESDALVTDDLFVLNYGDFKYCYKLIG